MGKNNIVYNLSCIYFACALSSQVGSLSNKTESNHTNMTDEENTQKKDETIKETVGTDYEITNYTNHLSKKYQSIFEVLKEKAVETKTKEEIDFLGRSYEDKFKEFINKTQYQNIKTMSERRYDSKFKEIVNKTQNQNIKSISGRRDAILHTLDSANVILDNLVRHLQDNLEGNSNEDEISAGLVRDEAAKIVERENEFICEKFNICRESENFADFLLEILTIISKLNHRKLVIMVNTLKGVAKKIGIDPVRDPMTKKMFIAAMDRSDHPYWVNTVFKRMKNVIEHKNNPLAALEPEPDGRIVAKTHAFIEALEAMEKVSPPTKENKELWKDIETGVKDWAEEKRKESEVKDILQKLINHIGTGVKSYYVGEKGVAKLDNLVNILVQ